MIKKDIMNNTFQLADKFGYESPFQNQENEFYERGILFNKLVNDIKNNNHFYFDYRRFISNIPETDIITPDGIGAPTGRLEDEPLFIRDKEGNNRRIKIKGRLNTRGGQLDIRQGRVFFAFKLNAREKITEYKVRIKYRFNNNLAVELTTFSYDDFSLLTNHIILEQTQNLKTLITDQFTKAIKNTGDNLSQLDWLYEHAPPFVLQKIAKTDLWKDLKKLLSYDKTKWFIDSSNAMIKVIQAIASKDGGMKYLYEQFESTPAFIKDIYNFLDKNGKSELHNGQKVPNKTIFASLLTQIVNYKYQGYQDNKHVKTNVVFRITEGFQVNSKLNKDKHDDKFSLTQEQLKQYTTYSGGTSPTTGITSGSSSGVRFSPIEQTQYLHPLDIVLLIIEDAKGEDITIPMPAVMIKDIAHQREWEEIQQILRIGLDILAVALGVIVLATTANPGVIALALADIGLAGTDIIVQLQKDKLMQTEDGKAFLKQWEQIYTIGGFAIAAISVPQLIRSTLTLGGNLYRLAKGTTREFLKNVLTKIILEINIANFTGNTLKVLDSTVDIRRVSKNALHTSKVEKLQHLGVIFVEGVTEAGKKEIGLFYKGEIIASGTGKNLKNTLKDVLAHAAGEKGMIKALDELHKIKALNIIDNGQNFFWKNAFGNELRWAKLKPETISKNIDIKLTKSDFGDIFEAQVGKKMHQLAKQHGDELTDFSNKVWAKNIKGKYKDDFGDIDFATKTYIGEVKSQLHNSDNIKKLHKQMQKYLPKNMSTHPKFLNPKLKKVVVVYEDLGNFNLNYPLLKELADSGVVFIKGITDLKKLY